MFSSNSPELAEKQHELSLFGNWILCNYGNFGKANITSLRFSSVARCFVVDEVRGCFAAFFDYVHECDAANEGLSIAKDYSKAGGR